MLTSAQWLSGPRPKNPRWNERARSYILLAAALFLAVPAAADEWAITRHEAAVVIAEKVKGLVAPTSDPGFTDLSGYEPAAPVWLHANGITVGCSADPLRYCPDETLTRHHIYLFAARWCGTTAPDITNPHQPAHEALFNRLVREMTHCRTNDVGASGGVGTSGGATVSPTTTSVPSCRWVQDWATDDPYPPLDPDEVRGWDRGWAFNDDWYFRQSGNGTWAWYRHSTSEGGGLPWTWHCPT